jgi:hypothetical protein
MDQDERIRQLEKKVQELEGKMEGLQEGFITLGERFANILSKPGTKALKQEILDLRGTPSPINSCAKCGGTGQQFILGEGTVRCECAPEFRQRCDLWALANKDKPPKPRKPKK